MCRQLVRTLFHLTCVIIYYFVVIYFTSNMELSSEIKNEYLTKMLKLAPFFLTHWNYFIHMVFLTMSLIYDVVEARGKHNSKRGRQLKYCLDVTFSGAMLPITLFVTSMFWTIYLIDRELIFPKVCDDIVPQWVGHSFHTKISVVVFLETVIQPRRHPADLKVEVSILAVFCIGYTAVYYAVSFIADMWLYVFFEFLTWWQICLLQLLIWCICFIFYFLQFPINRIFHKEEEMYNKDVVFGRSRSYDVQLGKTV